MVTISGMALTKGFVFIMILGFVLTVTEARPGTNFAGSSMTSDDSGTRSSGLVGSIPDSNSSDPSTQIYTSPNGGTTLLSTRNGVGLYSRTDPTDSGSQNSFPGPNQPPLPLLGGFGQPQPSTGYLGTGAGYGGVGFGAYTGADGPGSVAYAGPTISG